MAASDTRPIPLKGAAYRLYFPIQNSSGALVSGAAGLDSEVSIDGGTFADCTNEATEIGTSGWYYLDLTAGEMSGDSICISVKTSTSGAITTPIWLMPAEDSDIRVDVVRVSGDATAADNLESFMDGTGYAGTNNVIPLVTTVTNLTNAPTSGDLTATMKTSVTAAATAATPIAASVTGNVGGNVVGSVASVTAAVTVGTNNDKTGYGLSSTAIQAIWDALTSALTTSGSIGKRIIDNLDATISSRLATSGYTAPPTVTQVRTEMDSNSAKLANLDVTVSSRSTLTATDVWNALLSGMSTVGSVGKRIADNLDATITSRLASGSYTSPDNTSITAIKSKTDNLPATPASTADIPSASSVATAVWSNGSRTLTSFGSLVADVWAYTTRLLSTNPPTVVEIRQEIDTNSAKLVNLDTTVSSRLATSGYTAPPTASSVAAAVWSNGTRTLTSFGTLIVDLWAYTTRTLTSSGSGGATAQEVWEYTTRSLSANPPTAIEIRQEIDTNSTKLTSILADTNELQTDIANGGRVDNLIDSISTNVASILGQTGTSGVAISTAVKQAIADEILKRSASNVDGSASTHSLYEVIMAMFESSISGTAWTIRRSDGVTPFSTRSVTTDENALPITGVS